MKKANLSRRAALGAIGGALAGFPAILRGQQARRPNVLFVMTDDQRWDAMSCAGNRILKTPNMDRLAAGGVRFENGEYGMFDKRLMYEPSIRVPMLVRYPAAVRPGQVDKYHMVLNNDVAHTVLDCCGVKRPEVMRNHGESWRPVLEGRPVDWRKSWLYEYFEMPGPHCTGKHRGVRTSRHKLIHYIQEPQEYEFFDLDKDPAERRNLYGDPAYRDQVAELKEELERLRDLTNDDRSEDGTKPGTCMNRMAPIRWP